MKLALRTLTRNVHLLLVSFIVIMLGLGLLSSSTPLNSPAFELQQNHSTPSPSTSPTGATPEQASSTAVFASKTPSQSSYESQKHTQPSISTSITTQAAEPAPVTQPVTLTCTPCTTVSGCPHTCPVPAPPAPPEPITPLPPTGSCGPCGTYTGPRPQRIMCPMYCVAPLN